MRPSRFFSILAVAMWLPASAFAVTWGTFNTSSRTITATEGSRSITVQMPYPWGNEVAGDGNPANITYAGSSGGYYLFNKPGGQYRLKINTSGALLEVTIDSLVSTNRWGQVIGPKVTTTGNWRRADVSRYGETSGHDFNQKATYFDNEDLWAWAFWKAEESFGTFWKQHHPTYNPNSGSGTTHIAPDMQYHKNLAGDRQMLKEVLQIQVGDGIWDAVPTFPSNRESTYADELADTVYVDSWSHDSAAELSHNLRLLQRIAGEQTKFFSNWASWAAGGNDGFLPDALWLDPGPSYPSYPPNHTGYGSLDSMRAFADLGDATGWMSFRTFYSQLREEGPSYQQGLIRWTLDSAGNDDTTLLTKRQDQVAVYQRQEPEIQSYLGPSGLFTDTICKSYPWAHFDYDDDPTVVNGLRMSTLVDYDRDFADFANTTHGGPVTCEGLNNEVLLGDRAATGEFDIYFTLHRLVTPEYKLRRLHGLTTFHGAGLNYRATDISSQWGAGTNRFSWRNQDELDNYRTVQLLYGNGAFIYLENKLEDTLWHHVLGELLIVRPLQEHFALQPVSTIEYETSGSAPGTWYTLEQLIEDQNFVMKTNPGREASTGNLLAQSTEFERIRVTYANGLKIVANRGTADFTVNANGQNIVLPPDGWVAWGTIAGDSVLAYSAYKSGTTDRIDFIEDESQGVRFVDPRSTTYLDVDRPTQWVYKNGAWRVRLEADLDSARPAVILEGQRLPLAPARQVAASTHDHDFTQGFGGWRTLRGTRFAEISTDGLELDIRAKNPFLHSPWLNFAASTGDSFEVEFRFNAPTSGTTKFALLYKREGDAAFHGSRIVQTGQISVTGGWQTVSIPIGGHSLWDGSTIKQLRLDLTKGDSPAPPVDMTIRAVRLVTTP